MFGRFRNDCKNSLNSRSRGVGMQRPIAYTIVRKTFLDAMIGNVSTVLEKTAVITASSQIYSRHFARSADHFNDPHKAYAIIEQVRGAQLPTSWRPGLWPRLAAKRTERAISQLRLKLMAARSTDEVREPPRPDLHDGADPLDNPWGEHAKDQVTRDGRP